jgi:hypothetical protein
MLARCLAVALASFAQLHCPARGQCTPAFVPGSGLPSGAFGWVSAAKLWDPDGPGPAAPALVAGGQFTVPGASPIINLAVCDLTTGVWSAVPAWTFGAVTSLIVMPNGDLVAAGWPGPGMPSTQAVIARWNGSAWQQLGSANERIYTMALASNGDLFVGGAFTFLNGALLTGVARWDGANWLPLGFGLGGFAFATSMVTMQNGDLIVCGVFGPLGGTSSPGIARWNGTAWSTVGSGFGGMTIGNLLVAPNGDLLASSGNSQGVARWDGVTWTPLGSSPFFQAPYAPGPLLVLPDGDLLAGGYFAQTGPSPLLRWNGNTWTRLPAGGLVAQFPTSTAAPSAFVALPDGDIAVAGHFVSAGGLPSIGMARLRTPCASTVAQQGPGCASSGGSNTLAASSLPWIGSTFRARGEGLPGLAVVAMVYGLSPMALPLSAVLPQAQPGCDLLATPDFVSFAVATAGTADTALPLPDSQALVGMPFYHQLIPFEVNASFQILAVTATNALRLQIGAW